MSIRYDGRVAIVTGAAVGLGRSHALALAGRGAKVVVNDFGGDVHGTGGSSGPAERVAAEIRAAGGEAISNGADVSNPEQVAHMVAAAMETWGRIDILVNNAGILRDASFAKASLADFRTVVNVHLIGSAACSLAVWPHMRAANFGRILMTTSDLGAVRQFRPGQLRRRQDRVDRADERAADRGRQARHSRQRAVSVRVDAHDAGPAAAKRRSR